MAAPGGGRAGLGWALLAAALAVPGFLFYNWWSRQKAEHDRGVSAKAKARLPEGGVFPQSPPAERLVNPIAASSAAARGAAPAPARPAAPPAAAVPPASAAPAPARPAPAPAGPLAASAAATAPPASAAVPVSPVAVSSATTLVLARDPMLSPLDLVRIKEAELEEERRRLELEEALHRKKTAYRRPSEPPIEPRVELQGIVESPDGGRLAIVNGATVTPGEQFSVEGFKVKVKVVRIGATDVTFQYKKKTFRKSVNAD